MTASRLRRVAQAIQSKWPVIPLALGVLCVTGGWIGYSRLYPDASAADLFYASLQLLVLNGDANLGPFAAPLPPELSIARVVGAAVPASAVLLLGIRFLANRADLISGRRASGHLVVFGSTPEACQLAMARVATDHERQSGSQHVIVVGQLSVEAIGELRIAGAAVVAEAQGAALVRLLSGAAEIVILEATDGLALRRLSAIKAAHGSAHGTNSKRATPTIRVVLESTELARMQRSLTSPADATPITIVSLAEAVARRVTRPELLRPLSEGRSDHVVVVGSGEFASEIAVSAFQARFVRGRQIRFDLFAHRTDTWHSDVLSMLSSGQGNDTAVDDRPVVNTHQRQWSRSEELAAGIADACQSTHEQHHVFVAGLPDERMFLVSQHVARLLPDVSIVTVLQDNLLRGVDIDDVTKSYGRWQTVRATDLLMEVDVLHLAVVEQLSLHVALEFERLLSLPGRLADSAPARGYEQLSPIQRRFWSESLVVDILDALAHIDVHVEPGIDLSRETIGGPALLEARRIISSHLRALPSVIDDRPLPETMLRIAARMPTLLIRAGARLRADEHLITTLSPVEIDGLARSIHLSYQQGLRATSRSAAPMPHDIDWSMMTDEQREKNRRPARDIESRLLSLGYRLERLSAGKATPLHINGDELERLAEEEHEAWMLNQIVNGYRFGSDRNEDQRIHPKMVAYEALTDDDKEKDRRSIRQMPELLESIGWGVVPMAD